MTGRAQPMAAGYRIRDLTAGVVVLVIGAAMVHTVATGGAGASVFFTRWAFLLGAGALVLAYGTGILLDRVGGKYPVLTKRHDSPVPAAIVSSVAVTAVGYAVYTARHWALPLLERLVQLD